MDPKKRPKELQKFFYTYNDLLVSLIESIISQNQAHITLEKEDMEFRHEKATQVELIEAISYSIFLKFEKEVREEGKHLINKSTFFGFERKLISEGIIAILDFLYNVANQKLDYRADNEDISRLMITILSIEENIITLTQSAWRMRFGYNGAFGETHSGDFIVDIDKDGRILSIDLTEERKEAIIAKTNEHNTKVDERIITHRHEIENATWDYSEHGYEIKCPVTRELYGVCFRLLAAYFQINFKDIN